jgi:methylmalonyl-CoA mutase C-terminal domain/subunit
MALFPRVMELLRANEMDDVLVVAGGIIPDEDVSALSEIGVTGIFGPGTPTDEIVEFVRENVG